MFAVLRSRIPLSRAVLVDIGFVLTFTAVHVLDLLVSKGPTGFFWWWPALVSVPATGLLLLRRRVPWVALLVLLAATVTLTLARQPIGALNLAILVVIYTLCVRSRLRVAVAAAAVAMVYPISEQVSLSLGEQVLNIIGSVVNLVMVVGWGRAMRLGSRRADQLEQTVNLLDEARDQLAADAAVVERARIAREFHDIVSHNLSVVALRAGVARALVDRDPSHARETLRELEQTSSAALSEMRTMLSALREPGQPRQPGAAHVDESHAAAQPSSRQPAPCLDRVDTLVDSLRDSGVAWRLERRGAVRSLASSVEVTAYRTVQEAVTNVLKHAGPGYARVLLDYGGADLRVEVTNHITRAPLAGASEEPRQPRADPTAGHGLVGLRERVAMLGGTLTAHPIPGGFHLAAVLPCAESSDLT